MVNTQNLSRVPFSFSEESFFRLTYRLSSVETITMRHSTIENIIINLETAIGPSQEIQDFDSQSFASAGDIP